MGTVLEVAPAAVNPGPPVGAWSQNRGFREFAATNRVEGTAVFATLSLPLGRKPSK